MNNEEHNGKEVDEVVLLTWLEEWYTNNCNGDWEHSYGITIESTDNPGWCITIDLSETDLRDETLDYSLVETNQSDWYGIKIENSKFVACGDSRKLWFLLCEFRRFVNSISKKG